ncbi:MAG: hypothetical protein E6G38_07225 [Actinobacteria bacterium]|nr:MAG: hypothetical protein E6G38_07225 [Actinomycetota bacterium]
MRAELLDETRFLVDREPVDVMDRAEQVVPGIGCEEIRGLTLAARDVVDLETELDRESALFRLHYSPDVAVEVPNAPIEHVLLIP